MALRFRNTQDLELSLARAPMRARPRLALGANLSGATMADTVTGTPSDPLRQAILLRRAQRRQREQVQVTSALGFGIPFIDVSDITDGAKSIVGVVEDGAKAIGRGLKWTGSQVADFTDIVLEKLDEIGCEVADSTLGRIVTDAAAAVGGCVVGAVAASGPGCVAGAHTAAITADEGIRLAREACRAVRKARAVVDTVKAVIPGNTPRYVTPPPRAMRQLTFQTMTPFTVAAPVIQASARRVQLKRAAEAEAVARAKTKKIIIGGAAAAAVVFLLT